MRPSLIVQDVKKCLLSDLCVFFLVLGLPAATPGPRLRKDFSVYSEGPVCRLSLFFPPAPLCTGSAPRGEEERLPFFVRRKMIDPRLSRCTSFAGTLDASCYTGLRLSLRRLLLEHSVLLHCFPVLSCCVDELADLMLCAVCLRYGGKWAFSIVVAREEGQRVGVFAKAARTASHSRRAISK